MAEVDEPGGKSGRPASRLEQMRSFLRIRARWGTPPEGRLEPRDAASYAQGAADARTEIVNEFQRQIAIDDAEGRHAKIAHLFAARTIDMGDPYAAAMAVLREIDPVRVEDPPSGKLQVVK